MMILHFYILSSSLNSKHDARLNKRANIYEPCPSLIKSASLLLLL